MSILESFKLAFSNLRASKMRSFLTMLGIIIGVGAVIVIVGLGNGMKVFMSDQFKSMGTNTLQVSIMGRGSSRSVSVDDMYQIIDDNPEDFDLMSPSVGMKSTIKIGNETVSISTVDGVSEDYEEIKDFTITEGRGLQYADMLKRGKVCVVGSYVAKAHFDGDALGQSLKINGEKFTIVGVLKEEAGSEEYSADNALYLPYTTAMRLGGNATVSSYTVTVKDENLSAKSKYVLESALYDVFADSDAYMVISMAEMLDMMNTMMDVQITILAIIAGISLVVGGIGIMNIMLVSVSERTREIGIRKALGAKERYIMSQFVIEAATTSALGGIFGILLGYALSAVASMIVVSLLQVQMSVTPTNGAIALAFGISAFIGVLFGYLPAKKASQLNPIDALRYE